MYPIVSVILTYDSKRAITVTKKDDREFWIRQYDLETYEKTFDMQIGGNPDSFIRTKEVEQNDKGTKYAIVFIDDGKFKLRVFDKEKKEQHQFVDEEVDINSFLGINDYTMPIQGFADPFITCSFITDTKVFVQVFYNADLTHYHLIYDFETRSIVG